jgi:hypothetical protein
MIGMIAEEWRRLNSLQIMWESLTIKIGGEWAELISPFIHLIPPQT